MTHNQRVCRERKSEQCVFSSFEFLAPQIMSEPTKKQLRKAVTKAVAAADGELRGAEVLLRWHHPVLGEISPGEFLPVAEILGLASRLDHWVMEEKGCIGPLSAPSLPSPARHPTDGRPRHQCGGVCKHVKFVKTHNLRFTVGGG